MRLFTSSLLLAGVCLLATGPRMGEAQERPRFVYDVPDGRLKGGVRYSIRVEEIDRTADGLVLRVLQRSGPRLARRAASFRAICSYMAANDIKLVEVKMHGRDRAGERLRERDREADVLEVRFPKQVSQADLDDQSRNFFTDTLCRKLEAGPP